MKQLRIFIPLMLMLVAPYLGLAQEEKSYQAFWVHEDKVKPGMRDTYEKVTKDLVAACKEHNVQETEWITLRTNDNTYMYVTPINSMADLDKNGFETLSEKMGEDKMSALFERYNETYNKHGDYIIYLNKKLSYMPGGVSQTVDGEDYRIMYYNYVTPENDKGFAETMKKIKAAFEKNNSKMHYRVYKSGFGVMGTFYMVAVASEGEAQGAQRGDENWELMKDDFGPLLSELNKHTSKMDEKRGWMRPDLAYKPAK
jgi:hypothetical protein